MNRIRPISFSEYEALKAENEALQKERDEVLAECGRKDADVRTQEHRADTFKRDWLRTASTCADITAERDTLQAQLKALKEGDDSDYYCIPRIHHENDKAIYISQVDQIVAMRAQLKVAASALAFLNCKSQGDSVKRSHTEDCARCSALAKLGAAQKEGG